MYARVARAQVVPDQLEGALQRVREDNLPTVQQEGGKGMLVLVDRRSGKAMVVALYESEEAPQTTDAAFRARLGRTSGSQTRSASVEVYEMVDDVRF